MKLEIAVIGMVLSSAAIIAQANEELILDTTGLVTANSTPGWRDSRGYGYPTGGAVGLFVATNAPFVITRLDALVNLQQIHALANTAFELAVYRGTNSFRGGMLEDPDFCVQFTAEDTDSLQMTNLTGSRWLLSFTLPPYAWGTNRVLSIRTQPLYDGDFTTMDLALSSVTGTPGVRAFVPTLTVDTNLVLLPTNLPAVRFWRQTIASRGQVGYTRYGNEMELTYAPGFTLGSSTNLVTWDWTSNPGSLGVAFANTSEGNGFFQSKPDDAD
jgi:hypothetical protein